MTEAFLHYVWQFQYFNKEGLQTSDGETLQIFNPGIANTNSGPDFSEARIKIENLEWRGSVEIHVNSSGWIDHQHQVDEAYEKVILHVVWEHDKRIFYSDGSLIPTLELKDRVNPDLLFRFKKLVTNSETILCKDQWNNVADILKLSMLDKVVTERLKAKSRFVYDILQKTNTDWEETCYRLLCKNFGFKVNAEAMEQLAEALPYKIILKSIDKPYQVEALLLGQAGFLEKPSTDRYILLLQREFHLLSRKFNLEEKQMQESQWRFLRLRPANFPTIRLAQLATLFSAHANLFSKILECQSSKELTGLFKVNQSDYWLHHYRIGKLSSAKIHALGKSSIENLIINSVAPLLVAYGRLHDEQRFIDRAIDLLQHTLSEKNRITQQWVDLGFNVKTAFDSQGLIELFNNYCSKRRCLECSVGMHIVNKGI